ncbi:PALP-domain-containing protein [Mycena indigotica]|uniref:cysteine synthase n=1 Tax=Mycena indigotica TaxID=2126181 RepID=A0A8H6TDV2_9AGAR|nr:PALP-domain-containing protein [Mycena indigotica]KAF7315848.1 PALP-domain-containing protein [Mycena indigotica]
MLASLQVPRPLLLGILIGFSISVSSTAVFDYFQRRRRRIASTQEELAPASDNRPIELRKDDVLDGVVGLIGAKRATQYILPTYNLQEIPLLSVSRLFLMLWVLTSSQKQRHFLNPGGSVKDRVAVRIIDDAERLGLLWPHKGYRIFEGTSGSTGISVAMVARAKGYDATIITPDDMAKEKLHALLTLGADVEQVRPASIVDKKQLRTNIARQRALQFAPSISNDDQSESVIVESGPRHGFFADQFENKSNYDAHFTGTGPEIWRQTNGDVRAFVSGAGTGGTIAGVGRFLKARNKDIVVCLADCEGSGLYNKVKHGVMYDHREKEGTKRRHQVDTVVEGIGLNRLTKNLELALPIIDDAVRVTDPEAVAMARYLVKHDGLFVGSSSACNLVACVRLVRKMGWSRGERVVTVMCDSGARHYSKVRVFGKMGCVPTTLPLIIHIRNDEYLHNEGIPIDIGVVEKMLGTEGSLYSAMLERSQSEEDRRLSHITLV